MRTSRKDNNFNRFELLFFFILDVRKVNISVLGYFFPNGGQFTKSCHKMKFFLVRVLECDMHKWPRHIAQQAVCSWQGDSQLAILVGQKRGSVQVCEGRQKKTPLQLTRPEESTLTKVQVSLGVWTTSRPAWRTFCLKINKSAACIAQE